MKKILVLCDVDLKLDARVYRQLLTLNEHYSVTTVAPGSSDLPNITHYSIVNPKKTLLSKIKTSILLIPGFYETYYWSLKFIQSFQKVVKNKDFDVIIANDLMMLPVAIKIANKRARVIFDAHEYSPRQNEQSRLWRISFMGLAYHLCKTYMPETNGMMTVCQSISEEYEAEFGIKSVVVTNAPPYQELEPVPVKSNLIRMIHHGGAMPARHLEKMIKMMNFLDQRFRLDLMLMPTYPTYLEELKQLASSDNRIRFIEPVAMQDISKACNQYDVGVYILPPTNFNCQSALPNKLFEFIQARLAVAIGPSPEMRRIVDQYDCGVVSKTFNPESLAKSLSNLTQERIQYYKDQSHLAAKDLCAEKNAKKIIDLVG